MTYFHPRQISLDLGRDLAWGRLVEAPLLAGVWALLRPAGQQNHAPQLCWLRPSRLACVWMAGDAEGTAGMSVYLSELDAGTGQWSDPCRISEDGSRSEQNPLLFVDDGGHTHLIHTAQRVRGLTDSRVSSGSSFSMQWTAMLRHRSRAAGEQDWSATLDLIDSPAFCRHPPARSPSGGWLLPTYRSLEEGGGFGHDHSEVLPLDGDGQAVGERWPVPDSKGRVHGSIVPTAAGGDALLQFFRSRLADRIYRSRSEDGGRTWSAPQPTPLPNNNSSIQATRLSSGRLAMIFNRFGLPLENPLAPPWGEAVWPRNRWPLSIALSEDDGDTWPWVRDIDTGWGFMGAANRHLNGQLAYPTLVEGAPGDLHTAYSWAGRQAIRYLCLREEEIMGTAAERIGG
jgi:predicted neuraminidase